MNLAPEYKARLDHALKRNGQCSTKQRAHVFSVILEKRDHPTADEIYARACTKMRTISLATVYNCLETLVLKLKAAPPRRIYSAAYRYCLRRKVRRLPRRR